MNAFNVIAWALLIAVPTFAFLVVLGHEFRVALVGGLLVFNICLFIQALVKQALSQNS